jgi:hypothetical protein
MTFAALFAILQWVLPLAKAGFAVATKSKLPQEIIDALAAAVAGLEKVAGITEPTRAQVLALDIDPNAWGTPKVL